MDDQIRVSDADRERVTTRLRDHFAEGRLTHGELDERVSAALSAKTFGDLRPLMADLPGPVPAPPAARRPPRAGPPRRGYRRRPRVLPLILVALLVALVVPGGGWVIAAFFRLVLLLWLAFCLSGLFFGLFHRVHRYR